MKIAVEIGKRRKIQKGDDLASDCQGDTNLESTRKKEPQLKTCFHKIDLETSHGGICLINDFCEKAQPTIGRWS